MKRALVMTVLSTLISAPALAVDRQPSPPGANAYIVDPADGEHVPSRFTVRFGLQGMGVAPAGVDRSGTGHFHLIVDGRLPAFDRPMDRTVRHFGAGQTEVRLELPKGRHRLQLILGDAHHVPHVPPVVSAPIEITVD